MPRPPFVVVPLLLAAGAAAVLIPPLPPVPPPGPQQAQQARPLSLVFNTEFLEQSLYTAMVDGLGPLHQPPTPGGEAGATPVDVGCNYNVAGPPLNWHMWCAPQNATVVEWVDEGYAIHRKVTLKPQPGLTAEAFAWYTSGNSAPVVEWQGADWYWYALWHPIDHVQGQNRILLPPYKPPYLDGQEWRLQSQFYDIYQNMPASYTGTVTYTSNAPWYEVMDPVAHNANSSSSISLYVNGYIAWSLLLNVEDTPDGGVVVVRNILGAPLKGYDPVSPSLGYNVSAAQEINANALMPMYFQAFALTPNWEALEKAALRHFIEEFSNLGRFVPTLYKDPKANPLLGASKGRLNIPQIFSKVGAVLNRTGFSLAPQPPANVKKEIYLLPDGPPRGTQAPAQAKQWPFKGPPPPDSHQR